MAERKSFFSFVTKRRDTKNEEALQPENPIEDPVEKQISPDEAVGFEEDVSEDQSGDASNQEPAEVDPIMLLVKLKQRIEILERNKFETNQAFSNMNKIIGELRSRIMEQEKYIDILESKANIANDLVRTINPEMLGKDFEEQKAKIDAIDAKIESFISLADSVKSEIAAVDSRISSIGTPDDIRLMNRDMQNVLKGTIERETRLSARLERSENFFYDMQKNYTESLKFFSTVDAINASLKSMSSEYQKIELSLRNYVPTELFSKRISEIEHFLKHIENRYTSIIKSSGLRDNFLDGESIVISDSVKNIKATQEIESLIGRKDRDIEEPTQMPFIRRTATNSTPVRDLLKSGAEKKNVESVGVKPDSDILDGIRRKENPDSARQDPKQDPKQKPKKQDSTKSDFDDIIFSRSY